MLSVNYAFDPFHWELTLCVKDDERQRSHVLSSETGEVSRQNAPPVMTGQRELVVVDPVCVDGFDMGAVAILVTQLDGGNRLTSQDFEVVPFRTPAPGF